MLADDDGEGRDGADQLSPDVTSGPRERLMAAAARVGDTTNHGGTITGPGAATVLVGGQPAAVAGDLHTCVLPPQTHQPTVSAFPSGSATVLLAGRPALRTTDACVCGAMAAVGAPTVVIGG